MSTITLVRCGIQAINKKERHERSKNKIQNEEELKGEI